MVHLGCFPPRWTTRTRKMTTLRSRQDALRRAETKNREQQGDRRWGRTGVFAAEVTLPSSLSLPLSSLSSFSSPSLFSNAHTGPCRQRPRWHSCQAVPRPSWHRRRVPPRPEAKNRLAPLHNLPETCETPRRRPCRAAMPGRLCHRSRTRRASAGERAPQRLGRRPRSCRRSRSRRKRCNRTGPFTASAGMRTRRGVMMSVN